MILAINATVKSLMCNTLPTGASKFAIGITAMTNASASIRQIQPDGENNGGAAGNATVVRVLLVIRRSDL